MTDEIKYSGKDHFDHQLQQIANCELLGDSYREVCVTLPKNPNIIVKTYDWINCGELLAGPSAMNLIGTRYQANDIDLYFHTQDEAELFAKINNLKIKTQNELCAYTESKENLIYGVPYKDAVHLLSGFDIRACAIAYDPSIDMFVAVDGATEDAQKYRIVFQVGARSTTLRRLLKYLDKGFKIDKWQRAIFVELIRQQPNIDMEIIDLIDEKEYK